VELGHWQIKTGARIDVTSGVAQMSVRTDAIVVRTKVVWVKTSANVSRTKCVMVHEAIDKFSGADFILPQA
tara:strand:+ start:448 stop:660 length:213 start_codon:yes stop_codon:yes gene_type:complete